MLVASKQPRVDTQSEFGTESNINKLSLKIHDFGGNTWVSET